MQRKRTPHYCPRCDLVAETAYIERKDGSRRFESYCVLCNRVYKRDFMRSKLKIEEHTPKLDSETLALVSADPLWKQWLELPPREELEQQHGIAVQLQRKYRCCYKELSHSMRDAWITHWTKKLGHAPYTGKAG